MIKEIFRNAREARLLGLYVAVLFPLAKPCCYSCNWCVHATLRSSVLRQFSWYISYLLIPFVLFQWKCNCWYTNGPHLRKLNAKPLRFLTHVSECLDYKEISDRTWCTMVLNWMILYVWGIESLIHRIRWDVFSRHTRVALELTNSWVKESDKHYRHLYADKAVT